MNRGLLEAALERPKTAFYGREQYPELYQKAAVLMEDICKNHAMSDGNKRIAVAAAETMARINGCRLILPLKAVRLLADTAMDGGDQMSGQIQAWFKAHVASNPVQLRIMLDEIIDENGAIDEILKRGGEKITKTLDEWLAFDSHPELRTVGGRAQPGSGGSRAQSRRHARFSRQTPAPRRHTAARFGNIRGAQPARIRSTLCPDVQARSVVRPRLSRRVDGVGARLWCVRVHVRGSRVLEARAPPEFQG